MQIAGQEVPTGATAIVIGSGPAGMACALALLDAGKEVLMLDVGLRLEPERAKLLDVLSKLPPEQWRQNGNSDFLTEGMAAELSGVPMKLCYGSDYAYQSVPAATGLQCTNAYLQVSLAYGGFSNVWGSSMLPYIQTDMENWPIKAQDLAPHYRSVLQHVPLAGRVDDLAEVFPLFTDPIEPPTSAQARGLLDTLGKNRQKLREAGILAGTSRIAVQFQPCVRCGLCMFGCPYQLIYSSAFTVDKLLTHPRFRYVPGVYVKRVAESEGSVRVEGVAVDGGAAVQFEGERVFVGAGVVNTTTILLRSLEAYDRPVTMLDSDYFLQPALRAAGVPDVRREALHALTQAFMEISDRSVSKNTVHLQVYTHNELFEQAMNSAAGPLSNLLPKSAMLGRLLLLQGFIHSSDSASMRCVLKKTDAGDVFDVQGQGHGTSSQVVKRVQRKLFKTAALTGLVPLTPLVRMGDPGRSFHIGGTFPMSETPGELQSDTMGRPTGFTRVHAVDSSIFPSIAATTITLASMANAHRIASHAWD